MASVAKPCPAAGEASGGTLGPGEEQAGQSAAVSSGEATPGRVGHQKILQSLLPVDHE